MSTRLLMTLLALLGCLPRAHMLSATSATVVFNMTVPSLKDCNITKCPIKGTCNHVYFNEENSLCVLLYCPGNTSCEHLLVGNRQNGSGHVDVPPPARPSSLPAPDLPTDPARAPPHLVSGSRGSSINQSPIHSSNTSSSSHDQDQPRTQDPSPVSRKLENTSSASSHGLAGGPGGNHPTQTVPPTTPSAANHSTTTVPSTAQNAANATTNNAATTNAMTTIATTTITTATTTTTTTTATTITVTTNAMTSTTLSTTSTLAVSSHPNTSAATFSSQTPTRSNITSPTVILHETDPTTTTSLVPPLSHATHPVPPEGGAKSPTTSNPPHSSSGGRAEPPGSGAGGKDRIGQAVLEAAGEPQTSHVVNTSSLMAVLMFGLLFFVVTVILFLRQAYESYRRKDYTQVDYLINGMYSDSGV